MPLMTLEVDSDDEKYLPTVDLDNPVWSEEPDQITGSTYVSMRYSDQQLHPHSLIKECQ